MRVDKQTTITADEAEQLETLFIDQIDSRSARRRYLRRLRKLSGCSYATTHMTTSCGGTTNLIAGRQGAY